jgi:predicted HicB family RNase H-like nuclease
MNDIQIMTRKRRKDRKNLTIRMLPDLKKMAHQAAIEDGKSLSDWLEDVVLERLKLKVA